MNFKILYLLYKMSYPTYDQVNNIIEAKINRLPELFQCLAEYSVKNHHRCIEMYKSNYSKDVCQRIGGEINKEGGLTAMRGVWYIFFHTVAEMTQSIPLGVKDVEQFWDGIGENRY